MHILAIRVKSEGVREAVCMITYIFLYTLMYAGVITVHVKSLS